MIIQYLTAFACAVGLSFGNVIFKLVANSLKVTGSYFAFPTFLWSVLAVLVYGGATLAWIPLLQNAKLTNLYPFLGLSFALVPILSFLLLHESISLSQVIGFCILTLGVLLASGALKFG